MNKGKYENEVRAAIDKRFDSISFVGYDGDNEVYLLCDSRLANKKCGSPNWAVVSPDKKFSLKNQVLSISGY